MKLVFFGVGTLKNSGTRLRLVQFAERMAKEGHRCIVCLPSAPAQWDHLWEEGNRLTKALWLLLALGRRAAQMRHVLGADAVFIHRHITPGGFRPAIFEYVIRALNPRMIFDIDDAVWERESYSPSPFYHLTDFGWIWKMCRLCVHGVVGNGYLRDHLQQYNANLTIIPTCVGMAQHQPKTYPPDHPERPVVLGWTGTPGNIGFMGVIEEPIKRLAQKYNIALSFACPKEYRLEGVRVIYHRWELAHEIDYLQEADIGLMPLTDTPFSRGKCSLKALQYMAVGTPCVVSPVGMNAEVVEDGVDGFLATTPQEWYDKLERLIADPELRRRMGQAGRQKVIQRYSDEANYPKFKGVIERVAALRRR